MASHEPQPIRYIGTEIANTDYHDGQLRPAVGVHNYQVLRANRAHPEQADGFGWTYNHAPMLAYWQGRFYLEYLSNPVSEHVPPGQSLLTTSEDGLHWSKPRVVFPPYRVPDGIYQGPVSLPPNSDAVMHQRMGFYVAPDGRLLVLGFYGICPTPYVGPNDGRGIGRVVREIYPDGSFGPIYFIRYNRHAGWHEANTQYPFYQEAPDSSFIAACDALLADRLITLQWWEEDQSPDGFYAVEGYKAFCYYHLPDGKVIGLWKWSKAAISTDEGRTWSPVTDVPSLVMAGGKIWGQRTQDGQYALVYNPTPDNQHRWPLAIVTSEDGRHFNRLLAIHGEVPLRRYHGFAKDFGAQYVRGIVEGNGAPPDNAMWVTYSVNKEDIWISRIPIPVRHQVTAPAHDVFDDMTTGGVVRGWNVYSPRWAPVSVVAFPNESDKSLSLCDQDPYDYAKAERVFPESTRVAVVCRVLARQSQEGQLYIEIVDHRGSLATRLVFDADGCLRVKNSGRLVVIGQYEANTWYWIRFSIDTVTHRYDLRVNDELIVRGGYLTAPVATVERVVFRTGPRRRDPTPDTQITEMDDLPASNEPLTPSTFYINTVFTEHDQPGA